MNYFFVDAETDGLYGQYLSIAVLVTDECGNWIDHFYAALNNSLDEIKSEWVKENVFSHLRNAEIQYQNEYDLLEAFWGFWEKYRNNSYAVSDIMHPVESRLFTECVLHNLSSREYSAPFPLLDLSSILISKGIEWDLSRQELSGMDIASHDAMNDVKMTADIFWKIMKHQEKI